MFLVEKLNKIFKKIVIKGEIIVTIGITMVAMIIIYSYFLSGSEKSRDVKRYVDLVKINDELKIYHSKNKTFPLPDDSVSITASGKILTYQGNAGEKVFEALCIETINDPKKSKLFNYLNYYTYSTDEKKQSFQLMAFYESNEDEKYRPVSDRIPFSLGDSVGIAIENKFFRPIQETKLGVDVLNTLESYSIYNDNENKLVGDKLNLKIFVSKLPISTAISCLEIKNAGWNVSGFYYINPMFDSQIQNNTKSLKVYCDMENDGGGWTRIYYKKGSNTCFNDENIYSRSIMEKIFTSDFAVSDKTDSIKSEGSWILKNVDFKDKNFDFQKVSNVANCKTPTGTTWDINYGNQFKFYHEENGEKISRLDDNSGVLTLEGTFNSLGDFDTFFLGCDSYGKIGDKIKFNIGGFEGHTGIFINGRCNNFSTKDNSVTSKWDWDNTRTIWVR